MNKAVFFDRDGVINVKAIEHDYIKTWDEFILIPEIMGVMQHIQSKGYKIIIVTNQRGIARGLMTIDQLNDIHDNLQALLAFHNICITDIFYCPHDLHENCNCRKPKVGLLLDAQKQHHIDFEKSFLIGDSLTDIEAANKLNIKSILFTEKVMSNITDSVPDYIVTDLISVKKIVN